MKAFEIVQPGLPEPPDAPVDLPDLAEHRREAFARYVFSEELATAANVALHLRRPLLVTGEPGTGKTALAWGLARQLGAGDVLELHVKSSSVARDLLYTVDALRRFYDASVQDDAARSVEGYITYQALGAAIRSDRSRVVLIDEIDKAPRDFPNDLLNELDRMEFVVPELGPEVRFSTRVPHAVVITSNSERQLPSAFLRRCVYHHIEFPAEELLAEILAIHTEGLGLSEGFARLVVERFLALRRLDGLEKPPSTDELIAWTRVLAALGVTPEALQRPLGELPALQTLVKVSDDLQVARAAR